MKYTLKIQKAIKFAIKTHDVYQKQKRKGKDIAYITHPLTVGIILSCAGASEGVIAAGILHDTMEDSTAEKRVTKEMLAERFGDHVSELVTSVTEHNKNLPWEVRKKEALEHIKTFSHDSLLVKSADVISNVSEIIDDHARYGDDVFERFNTPEPKKGKTIQNYLQVITALIGAWDQNPLISDLNSLTENLHHLDPQQDLKKGTKKPLKKTAGKGGLLEQAKPRGSEIRSDLKDIYLGAVEKDHGWDVKVYLINTSDRAKTIQLLQGSFQGDTEGLLDLGHSGYNEITIPARGFVQIDHMDDAGQLDFTTYYTIKAGDDEYLDQINGWSFSKDKMVTIPCLNEKGYFSGFGRVGKP